MENRKSALTVGGENKIIEIFKLEKCGGKLIVLRQTKLDTIYNTKCTTCKR